MSARGLALRLRVAEVGSPEGVGDEPAPPGPERGVRQVGRGGEVGFHNAGAELRFVRGGFAEPGPALVWVRLAAPLVAGESPSPLVRPPTSATA